MSKILWYFLDIFDILIVSKICYFPTLINATICSLLFSHWFNKRLTPRHAIVGASERRTRGRCVAMRSCGSGKVVRAMLWRKIWNAQKNVSIVSRLVTTKLLSAHALHWVSRISWTVRNLCATDGTTWRKLCVTLASWETSYHYCSFTIGLL